MALALAIVSACPRPAIFRISRRSCEPRRRGQLSLGLKPSPAPDHLGAGIRGWMLFGPDLSDQGHGVGEVLVGEVEVVAEVEVGGGAGGVQPATFDMIG